MTSVKVFVNIYDGFIESGDEIKNGLLKGGQQIMKKRYGNEAE